MSVEQLQTCVPHLPLLYFFLQVGQHLQGLERVLDEQQRLQSAVQPDGQSPDR